jgi:hypothetical protein
MKYLLNLIIVLTIAVYIAAGIGSLFLAKEFGKGTLEAFCILIAGLGSFYHGVGLSNRYMGINK